MVKRGMKRRGLPLRKADRHYTYGDYKNWPDNERWEIIEGVAWDMSAAPNRQHQDFSMALALEIGNFLKGRNCKLYAAPFDVLLPEYDETQEDDVSNVVQPDISVICNPDKLTDKGCTGAPDWIIEIQSPFTSKKDMDYKFYLYERHRVREYWIADPGNRCIHEYVLGGKNKYPEEPEIFLPRDSITCTVLEGLVIDLDSVFRA